MTSLSLYRILTFLATPFIYVWLYIRLLRGKEDSKRIYERFGFQMHARPTGKLIWLHGASVGECLSMMPLINRLLEQNKNLKIMVTSGTVSSAKLMEKRLPKRAFHEYIPVDIQGACRRMVRHFKPDAVLWFESEFWPNILGEIRKADIPLILLNGRISDRSFQRWQKALWIIKPLLSLFTLTFGQTEEDARRLRVLGARETICVGNLKYAAPPAPFDAVELRRLLRQIGKRPVWVGGSTHPGEEEMMADIHVQVAKAFPGLLTVSAPRHPERGNEVRRIFEKRGLKVAQRTKEEAITPDTDVYFADTLGEMGLIYRLSPIVFVGGSLVPFGGQNMLEPMRLGRLVMIGPNAFNFREIVSFSKERGALVEVADATSMLGNLVFYLKNKDERRAVGRRAQTFAVSAMAVLDRVYDVLKERLDLK